MERIILKRLVLFCEKFGQLIHSGIPILETFEVLKNEFRDDIICVTGIKQMETNVNNGVSLVNENLVLFATSFSQALIDAGEKKGTLDYCLLRIAKAYEKELLLTKPDSIV